MARSEPLIVDAQPAAAPGAPTATAGFSLAVPRSWFEIDLRPSTRDASIAALVDTRVRDVPALADQRAAVVRLLRTVAREAERAGAVYCAAMAEPVDGLGLTASVTVSLLDAGAGGVVPRDARGIAASLRAKAARGPDDTWRTVRLVDLPGAGPAARATGVEDVDLPERGGWVRCVTMETLVPVPGAPGRVALVACSSPSLHLAEAMHDLFDAVSSTFTFVRADGSPDTT